MPQPPDESRAPNEFADFLLTEEPLLIVGGQAVNLWALHYYERTEDLSPFVSRDIDVLGDLETLEKLAQIAGVNPIRFPLRPPTNEIGAVVSQSQDGTPLLIEVLRYVHGVSNKELSTPAYLFKVLAATVRVPGPIPLLQAKLANLADLPQAGRQDEKHVRILIRVLPPYLHDLANAARSGELSERAVTNLMEKLLKTISEKKNARLLSTKKMDVSLLFGELDPNGLPKLKAFLEKRLPRVRKS